MSEQPLVPLPEAYKIGNKMSRPWMFASFVLGAVVVYLLYMIQSAEFEATANVDAERITANQLTSNVSMKE